MKQEAYEWQGRGSCLWKEQRDKKRNRSSEKQDFPDLSFRSCFHFLKKCLDHIVFTIYGLCVAWQFSEIILGFSREGAVQSVQVLQNPILLNYFLKALSVLFCLFLTYGNKTVTFPFLFVNSMWHLTDIW